MPVKTRYEWYGQIKSVEREYKAVRCAVEHWLQPAHGVAIPEDLKVRDFQKANELLEDTYFIRLFAEFETSLRLFWTATRKTEPPARARDLLDGIAAKQRIPPDRLLNVHKVRGYRNLLVHEREEYVSPISLDAARSDLCYFLSYLGPAW